MQHCTVLLCICSTPSSEVLAVLEMNLVVALAIILLQILLYTLLNLVLLQGRIVQELIQRNLAAFNFCLRARMDIQCKNTARS